MQRRTGLIGASLLLAGIPVFMWAPGVFPVAGVLLAIVGLVLLVKARTPANPGPTSASPSSDLLWRGGTGGPPNPPRDSGMNYPRI